MSKPFYFFSHRRPGGEFSQFYPSKFTVDGKQYCCVEQWVMSEKALLMGDQKTAQRVMRETNPIKIRSLGRRVKPWNQDLWEKKRFSIMLQGNMHKFRQNPKLMKKLRQTGKRTLAEASDKDYINGIGISIKDAIKGKKWRGLNLLGKALMKVRKKMNKK